MSERTLHIYESDNSYYLRIAPPAELDKLLQVPDIFTGHYRPANSGGWLYGHVVLYTTDNQVLGFDKDYMQTNGLPIETCAQIIAESVNALVATCLTHDAMPLEKLETEFGCINPL